MQHTFPWGFQYSPPPPGQFKYSNFSQSIIQRSLWQIRWWENQFSYKNQNSCWLFYCLIFIAHCYCMQWQIPICWSFLINKCRRIYSIFWMFIKIVKFQKEHSGLNKHLPDITVRRYLLQSLNFKSGQKRASNECQKVSPSCLYFFVLAACSKRHEQCVCIYLRTRDLSATCETERRRGRRLEETHN